MSFWQLWLVLPRWSSCLLAIKHGCRLWSCGKTIGRMPEIDSDYIVSTSLQKQSFHYLENCGKYRFIDGAKARYGKYCNNGIVYNDSILHSISSIYSDSVDYIYRQNIEVIIPRLQFHSQRPQLVLFIVSSTTQEVHDSCRVPIMVSFHFWMPLYTDNTNHCSLHQEWSPSDWTAY